MGAEILIFSRRASVLVKVSTGADRHKVALRIENNVEGMTAIESPNLFGAFRQQMTGLLWGFLVLLIIAWVAGAVLVALVFSLAANERRREVAVLRIMGATRLYVFRSLLSEATLLALAGGAIGILSASAGIFIFRDYIAASLRMPFLFPSAATLLIMLTAAIGASMLTVTLAALFPSLRISSQEPAIAMRE